MSSAAVTEQPVGDDRTARARIRDAAIGCFADGGLGGTTVRTIAEAADVSPALVIHHFGSKRGLRAACDAFVATTIRETKSAAMAAGPGLDPFAALREGQTGPPLLAYLARTLVEGDAPEVAALVDELVADAVEYMAEGVRTGVLQPTDYPFERAAVLTAWSLGALVLHEHVERLLGVDLTGGPEALSAAPGYFAAALEMLAGGVVSESVVARARAALAEQERQSKEGGA